MIIVVAVSGWSGGTGVKAERAPGALQVFPASGDVNSWSRLVGQVLAAFFGWKRPAIHDLRIDSSFDELTADIIEGWATCFWAVQACLDCARRHRDNAGLVRPLEALAQTLYTVTRLQEVELTGPAVMSVIEAMNEAYAARLGIDAEAVIRAHLSQSGKLAAVRSPSQRLSVTSA
jgi:hypothetical protein